jgi:TPR repeat protein
MRTRSKKRPRVDRADPPAPETPGAGVVDAVDAPVPVPVPADALRLVLERFDRLEDELRKSRAEHLETRRTLAELVRSIRPTFDVNEQVASLVFAHVRDVRSRLALAQVSTTWHKASKQASSLPKSLDFSGIPVSDWDTLCYGRCSQEVAYVLGFNGVLDLPDAHFHALLEQAGADLSDRKVQGVIGNLYFNADRDEKALKWYHLGARQGDSHCEYSIGDNYINGYGVEINLDTALEWFEKAAAKGHAGAQVGIGDVNYTKERYEDAVTWFTKAADQGDAEAEHRLGYCYQFGNGVELNLDTALAWFEKAAAKGHADGQFGIGVVNYTKERYEEAVTWFTKAADQHDTEAESWLGYCYQFGNGVELNLDTALAWFEKAAAKGHTGAQVGIGVVSYTKERYEDAVTWFTKAAEQHDADAERWLGHCYRFGNGVEQNFDTALEWYEKAAAKGHAGAQYGIGIVNYKKERYEEAVTWFTKAAAQGDTNAEVHLGDCYRKGRGVTRDIPKAIEWYTKAAEKVDTEAAESLRELTQLAAST